MNDTSIKNRDYSTFSYSIDSKQVDVFNLVCFSITPKDALRGEVIRNAIWITNTLIDKIMSLCSIKTGKFNLILAPVCPNQNAVKKKLDAYTLGYINGKILKSW